MAVTLTTTVGGEDANSYADAAYALTYFAGRLGGEAWDAVSGADGREQALLSAMRVLESLPFIGTRADSQSLEWPRVANCPQERGRGVGAMTGGGSGLYDRRGRWWAATVIPAPIKDAQCEIALALIGDTSTLSLHSGTQVSFAAGSVKIEQRKPQLAQLRSQAMQMLDGLVEYGTELLST